jgi:hypothetical protein
VFGHPVFDLVDIHLTDVLLVLYRGHFLYNQSNTPGI